tara:strand:- start:591 stop:1214 length:624 start_codon:yes stop_codon:yes gene_type:complete
LLAIIQARTNSKRFKNKVLEPIYGRSMIFHVCERVKKSKRVKKTIVATSSNKSDTKLVIHLKKMKIETFRGNLNNVAKRFLKLAKIEKAKYFLRISGDSPLIDSKIIDHACKFLSKNENKYDLITNIFPRTFPKGQSVEIVKTTTLEKHITKFTEDEKEHVTKYFYKNAKKFKIKNFYYNGKKKEIDQSVDYKKDLILIKKKFKNKF